MRKLITATLLATLMAGSALADTKLKLVEVITSPERTETLKSIVAKFEQANPGTTVEIISLPWGEAFQKFATMVSAGEIPDVMEMPDTWLSLYANNGMLESLEPYLEKWEHTPGLTERALELGRDVNDTAYMLPYGFYLRAMFYNKKLLSEAGVAEPPKTMDDFVKASEAVSKLPGKSGYCLRGGPGGLNGWVMFGATMAGDNKFFNEDGTSTMNSEGWIKGLTWVIDLYKNGLAPKDSVNWGLQRDRRRLLQRHLRLPRPGSGRVDRDRPAHEAGGFRRHHHAQGAERQGLYHDRLCRLVDSCRQPEQGSLLEADRNAGRPGRQYRVEQAHRRAARP